MIIKKRCLSGKELTEYVRSIYGDRVRTVTLKPGKHECFLLDSKSGKKLLWAGSNHDLAEKLSTPGFDYESIFSIKRGLGVEVEAKPIMSWADNEAVAVKAHLKSFMEILGIEELPSMKLVDGSVVIKYKGTEFPLPRTRSRAKTDQKGK